MSNFTEGQLKGAKKMLELYGVNDPTEAEAISFAEFYQRVSQELPTPETEAKSIEFGFTQGHNICQAYQDFANSINRSRGAET